MKPCAFELHRPRELAEALDLLERLGDDARLIAGGQSLVPMMNLRIAAPAALVDLNSVNGLSGVRRDSDVLRIGAMTRQQCLIEDDLIRRHAALLAKAAQHIGHYSTRSRGTIGGSLANADPSSELALAAVTLGADLVVRGREGTRMIAAEEFFLDALKTALLPTEILTEIVIPIAPDGAITAFHEYARRHGDFATAAAAALLSPSQTKLRVGLGAVGPVPVLCKRIQDAFSKGELPSRLDELIDDEIADVETLSDVHTSAAYRRRLGTVCLGDCVRELIA
jgi:CO/xanthine dehydrogenase FAD-binding subunit